MRARISEYSPRLIKANTGCVLAISLRCVLMIFKFIRAHQIWLSLHTDGALPLSMTAFRFASSLRKSLQSRLTCSVCVLLLEGICNLGLWIQTVKEFTAVRTRPRARCLQSGCATLPAMKSKSLLPQQVGNR